MAVHPFRGTVGDTPVVESIPARPPVPFGKIGRDRRRRSDHLVGEALQRRGGSFDKADGFAGGLDRPVVDHEVAASDRVGHDHLRVVHGNRRVDPVLDVKGRAATRHALDIERRIDDSHLENDPEVIVQRAETAIRGSGGDEVGLSR